MAGACVDGGESGGNVGVSGLWRDVATGAAGCGAAADRGRPLGAAHRGEKALNWSAHLACPLAQGWLAVGAVDGLGAGG